MILLGFLISVISTNGQTDKEIGKLTLLLNSKEYKYQDSLVWIDLMPLKEKSDSLEELGKKALKSGDNEKTQVLMRQYIDCTKEKLGVLGKYPDFVYSADYLLMLTMKDRDIESKAPKIGSMDEYKRIYESFSKEVKESYFGKGLKMLFDNEIPKIGEIAPDIDLYTSDGKLLKLSDFKGKYVLIKTYLGGCQGWAIEHPKIKEIYQNLDKRKIVVIGVCIDNDKSGWTVNQNKYGFDWISTFQPIGGKMTVIYNISSNSRNVLIDPNGTIVDMDIPIQSGQLLTRLEKAMNK